MSASGTTSSGHTRRRVAPEILAVVSVGAIAAILLWHISATGWRSLMLLNGDSLVLPMVAQSIAHGEPFLWAFSSQMFLFPEAVLYAPSWLLTGQPAASLAVNAALNVLVLYGLLRWSARWLVPEGSAFGRATAAAMAILPFAVCCLSEQLAVYNGPTFANLFLFTTYYYGVILVGAFLVALLLHAAKGFSAQSLRFGRRQLICAIVAFVVLALATLSDPLVVPQVTAPLALALTVLVILRKWSVRALLWWAAVGLLGSLVGYAARYVFRAFISPNAVSYFHLSDAHASLLYLVRTAGELLSSGWGIVEIVVAAATVVAAVVVLARSRRLQSPAATVFAAVFSLAAVLACFGLTVVSGSEVTRYLIPVYVLPSVGVLAWLGTVRWQTDVGHARTSSPLVAGALAAILVVAGGVSAPSTATAFGTAQKVAGLTCLEGWIGGRSLTGAGSFWETRALRLYGPSNVDLLQLNFDLTAQAWMINLQTFFHKRVSYFLVSHEVDWDRIVDAYLGKPASTHDCGEFVIYDYAGTPGEATLTDIVASSAATNLRERGGN